MSRLVAEILSLVPTVLISTLASMGRVLRDDATRATLPSALFKFS